MTLGQKIKMMRQQKELSQEGLANLLGVSRQAITKWESDRGIPDIDNLKALADLFGMSIDELIQKTDELPELPESFYESIVMYDVAAEKHYDINFGSVRELCVTGYEGEKLRIRLSSETVSTLEEVMKVGYDESAKSIDINIFRKEGLSELEAKEQVKLEILFPAKYLEDVELAGYAAKVSVSHMNVEELELSGEFQMMTIQDVSGHLEVDCNQDMTIHLEGLQGRFDLNQVHATSRLYVPEGYAFTARKKGIRTHIYDETGTKDAATDNMIELNGMRSELYIMKA